MCLILQDRIWIVQIPFVRIVDDEDYYYHIIIIIIIIIITIVVIVVVVIVIVVVLLFLRMPIFHSKAVSIETKRTWTSKSNKIINAMEF